MSTEQSVELVSTLHGDECVCRNSADPNIAFGENLKKNRRYPHGCATRII